MENNFGVIFDMDGVIVKSNPFHKKAIKTFLSNHDKDISDSDLKENVFGRTNKDWIPEIFGDISSDKLKELSEEKEEIFRDIFTPEENAVDGIHQFLDKLKDQNIPMNLATSAPMKNADYILSHLSLEDYFTSRLGPDDIEEGKPDPEIYLKASKALGKEPENCIVVEDSISGVKSGLNAGTKVIGVTTTQTAEDLDNCHLIIDDFNELDIEDLRNLF
jgi:HAD superfamily hydrolase (TIGR01509 family)